jgi:hypothetical protein
MQISLMGKAEADVASSPTRQTALGFEGLRKKKKMTHVSNREVDDYPVCFDWGPLVYIPMTDPCLPYTPGSSQQVRRAT